MKNDASASSDPRYQVKNPEAEAALKEIGEMLGRATPEGMGFEKHVKGRWKYNYHRTDDRTEETHTEKEQRAAATRAFFQSEKKRKKQAWRASKEERSRVFAELKRKNEEMRRKESRRLLIHRVRDATARIFKVSLQHIRHACSIITTKESSKE